MENKIIFLKTLCLVQSTLHTNGHQEQRCFNFKTLQLPELFGRCVHEVSTVDHKAFKTRIPFTPSQDRSPLHCFAIFHTSRKKIITTPPRLLKVMPIWEPNAPGSRHKDHTFQRTSSNGNFLQFLQRLVSFLYKSMNFWYLLLVLHKVENQQAHLLAPLWNPILEMPQSRKNWETGVETRGDWVPNFGDGLGPERIRGHRGGADIRQVPPSGPPVSLAAR